MNPEERTKFRQKLREEANALGTVDAHTGLEWANAREIEAIGDENSGFVGSYITIVRRAIQARTRAVIQEERKAS